MKTNRRVVPAESLFIADSTVAPELLNKSSNERRASSGEAFHGSCCIEAPAGCMAQLRTREPGVPRASAGLPTLVESKENAENNFEGRPRPGSEALGDGI